MGHPGTGTVCAADNLAGAETQTGPSTERTAAAATEYGRVIPEPDTWERCCVVGSGPSLQNFDFSVLSSCTVLAVNDALFQIPWARAVFTLDHTWLRRRLADLCLFDCEKFVAIADRHEDLRGISCLTYLRRSIQQGLSSQSDTICAGGCSGYGAVNVAVLKGAKYIDLYGFDLVPGRAFGGGREQRSRYAAWAAEFRFMLPFLLKNGITVVNRSAISRIDAFEKRED